MTSKSLPLINTPDREIIDGYDAKIEFYDHYLRIFLHYKAFETLGESEVKSGEAEIMIDHILTYAKLKSDEIIIEGVNGIFALVLGNYGIYFERYESAVQIVELIMAHIGIDG